MENLQIEKKDTTPFVFFDFEKNQLLLEGKSYPENTFAFYKPVLRWIEKYFLEKRPATIFTFKTLYYNSSSFKILFDIFSILEEYSKKGHEIQIIWIYKKLDDDAKQSGKDFIEDFPTLEINLQTLES